MKLSVTDNAFLQMETVECPAHVGSLAIFQIPEGYEGNFVKDLSERLLEQKEVSTPFNLKLRDKGLVPGWPEWEIDKNLDLSFHVRHSALPAPGSQEDLLKLANRIHARQLDRAHPLWELYLIEGLEGNRFVLYTKIHHAMIDGAGGIAIMDRVYSEVADLTEVKALWNPQIERPKRKKREFSVVKSVVKPYVKLLDTALSTPGALLSMATAATGLRNTRAGSLYRGAKSVFTGKVSSSRAFGLGEISLDDIKAVSKAHGATINDTFMCVCSGALGRYLYGRKKPADQYISAMVPVAMPKKEGQTSNAVSAMLIRMHPHIKDPVKRLKAIQGSAEDAKSDFQSNTDQVNNATTAITQASIGLMGRLGLADKLPPSIGLVISNVPGLKTRRYLMGAELTGIYPMSMLAAGNGLNITVMSYAGKFQYGLLTTPNMAPDIQEVADAIGKEFELLKKAKPKAKQHPARTGARLGKKVANTVKQATAKPVSVADTQKAPGKQAAAKPAVKKASGKKATVKKAAAKKPVVKKAPAKKAVARKAATRTTSAKKTAAKKTSVKKATASKPAAKKTTARTASVSKAAE